MTNRIIVKDYWKDRNLILAYSRQDKGLIAIGEPLSAGGERFIHVRVEDLERIIKMSKEN